MLGSPGSAPSLTPRRIEPTLNAVFVSGKVQGMAGVTGLEPSAYGVTGLDLISFVVKSYHF